jgi:signal transduction histidine kinase
MGLATASQIAKLHGGAIDVTSDFGRGSCFTVRIPAEVFTLEKP